MGKRCGTCCKPFQEMDENTLVWKTISGEIIDGEFSELSEDDVYQCEECG